MKHWALFSLVALLATVPALAQKTTVRLGLRGSLGSGTILNLGPTPHPGKTIGDSYLYSASPSWQAGAVLDIRHGRLAVQPGLLLTQQGYNYELSAFQLVVSSSYGSGYNPFYYNDAGTERRVSLQAPVDVVFTLFRDHGPQLLAGAYAGLGVGGSRRGSRSFTNSDSPSGDYDEPLAYGRTGYHPRFEAGLRLGVGYRLGPLQLQLAYAWGLTNLHQRPDPLLTPYHVGTDPANPAYFYGYYDFQSFAARSRVWQLAGTYFLPL